ncbi:hypothetical protein PR048_032718 [Dryococelus australis]|uniref:Uncharacterized protein n=1 Tax=Dryococelus australis TaxID=614101 RepID=A0ABQ9G302_9NEOP|nr:hypothetical protein PR048_032718 [Dryococelus australis]
MPNRCYEVNRPYNDGSGGRQAAAARQGKHSRVHVAGRAPRSLQHGTTQQLAAVSRLLDDYLVGGGQQPPATIVKARALRPAIDNRTSDLKSVRNLVQSNKARSLKQRQDVITGRISRRAIVAIAACTTRRWCGKIWRIQTFLTLSLAVNDSRRVKVEVRGYIRRVSGRVAIAAVAVAAAAGASTRASNITRARGRDAGWAVTSTRGVRAPRCAAGCVGGVRGVWRVWGVRHLQHHKPHHLYTCSLSVFSIAFKGSRELTDSLRWESGPPPPAYSLLPGFDPAPKRLLIQRTYTLLNKLTSARDLKDVLYGELHSNLVPLALVLYRHLILVDDLTYFSDKGATVAEWLACSPPTKAIRVQSPPGSLQIFGCGNSAGRCHWSAGFLGDLLFTPPFHFGTAPFSPQSPSSALKTLISWEEICLAACGKGDNVDLGVPTYLLVIGKYVFRVLHMKQRSDTEHLLANRAPPGTSLTVQLEVRLQVKTLDMFTVVAARRKCDSFVGYRTLQGHLENVERLVRCFVLASVYAQRGCVHRHLDARWPVGVHLPVLVVETLKLELQSLLTLNGQGRLQVGEAGLDIGVGADVRGHTAGRCQRWCGITRNGAVLVAHVAAHSSHILVKLGARARPVLPHSCRSPILRPRPCVMGRELGTRRGDATCTEVLVTRLGAGRVWRCCLPHAHGAPTHPRRGAERPRWTHGLLGWVLRLEAWPSITVASWVL